MQRVLSRGQANFVLLLSACVWGIAFVPQAIAAQYIGAFSFSGVRFLLGALIISPLVWREWLHLKTKNNIPKVHDWLNIALMGALLCAGAGLQQYGLAYTSATNAGFLTTLYVPMVPFLGYVLYKRRVHWAVWPCVLLCVFGTWMLTGAGKVSLNVGDLWIMATIIPFSFHVLWVGSIAEKLQAPLLVAFGQFAVCGILSFLIAWPLETFDWGNISYLILPILYMSIFSVSIGFTGQVIGQRFARPADAAIILSSEGVFAALAGAVLLHERLSILGYFGCTLILMGIIVVQLLPPHPTPLIEQH